MSNTIIRRVEAEGNALHVSRLKRMDDSGTGQRIHEEFVLQRVIEWQKMCYDTWIAKTGDEIVGYAVDRQLGEGYLSYGIYVTPACRNNGIGTLLEAAQIGRARALGREYIRSSVSVGNGPSMRIQEKFGFAFDRSGTEYIVTKKL